jgi:hypothetical protein
MSGETTHLTVGDWIKRDGKQFQVRAVEENRIKIGNSDSRAKWYPSEKVESLLARDDVEVFESPEDTLTQGQHCSGWA